MKKETILRSIRLAISMAETNKRRRVWDILDIVLTVLYMGGFFWLFTYAIYKVWQTGILY